VGTSTPPTRRTEFTIERDGFYAQRWSFWEHTATHLDAPGHFVRGGRLTPELDPDELMFIPAEVIDIDITARARRNPDAKVELHDIRAHERRYGRIPHAPWC
jgi:kynurenine formamidase